MPRKIKVSDITPESNETPPINNDVEEVKEPEPVVETQEKQEEKVEEPQEETPQEIQETPTEIVEEPQEETKTRNQELRQCPKCHKWLTAKTLKYFHECTKNDTVKAKRRPPKKKIEVKDIEDINEDDQPPIPVKLVRQTNIVKQGEKFLKSLSTDKIDYTPPVEISYEDMRRDRIKQRIQQRAIKMSNLFTNAI
tara:strand:- start:366 stop:950 length:585 start_codon:yes stop_codon:yes gene_type:complete